MSDERTNAPGEPGTPEAADVAGAPGTADAAVQRTAGGALSGAVAAGSPVPETVPERHGMFHVRDGGDTTGYNRLVLAAHGPAPAARPFGGYFDEIADELAAAMAERGIPEDAIEQVTIAAGEMTVYVQRGHLVGLLQVLRDDPALHFEMLSSLSGVDYGVDVPRRLHVVYELMSLTFRRRVRLEVAVDVDDATVPSAVSVYPTADWHERETYDMFGVVFAGHPGLSRILMPDDWIGHPQRKDYPLGGIPVEYKGHEILPADQRRAYT
jgi:NADH-quinone oxidoreductase subunit C